MPSYAYEVKNELARIFDEDKNCLRAELAALLKFGAIFFDGRAEFTNSNAAVARKVVTLAKKIFSESHLEVAAIRTKKLRKTMRYVVRIFSNTDTQNFFDELNSNEIVRRQIFKVAYLRGAFLAGGTINRPEKHYHFEIASVDENTAKFTKKILSRLEFNTQIYGRKDEFVVYMSEGDSICDFLGMVGAEKALERFEVARNLKEIRSQVNRIVNCETANVNKAVEAAQRQLEDIRILIANNVAVKENLQKVMQSRLDNPDCTVGELAEKIFLSRPGLMYHFKIIHKLADKFR